MRLRTSSSHEEGGQRQWQVLTKAFEGVRGKIQRLKTVTVEFETSTDGPPKMHEVPGSEQSLPADLVLLAMGFTGPETQTIVDQLQLDLDDRGNIRTDNMYQTSKAGVFSAGDARRGQSLIVWAISEGREAARAVDVHLMGRSILPAKGKGDLPPAPF
jgi:glutamate synthase (NADPH/NADH) small chain